MSDELAEDPNESFPQPSGEQASGKSVKLPYFHRTLSEEDKKLIGDIAPKKIENSSASSVNVSTSLTTSAPWNQGTTWVSILE